MDFNFIITDDEEEEEASFRRVFTSITKQNIIDEFNAKEIWYGTHFLLKQNNYQVILAICITNAFLSPGKKGEFLLYFNNEDSGKQADREMALNEFLKILNL